jgi:hypothetical protein
MPLLPRWALTALTSLPLLAPIAPYPQAPPLPSDGSRLPALVDDDEKVLVKLAPDGRVTGIRDDLLIQVAGSGDYVLVLPGRVEDVTNQGGDTPPGLQDGHISFLGHLEGRRVLAAEARLDPERHAVELPMEVAISYFQDGKRLDPGAAAGRPGTFRQHIDIRNLTGKPMTFARGRPDIAVVAQVLEALRGVPSIYTPEIDLGAVYPLPTFLPLTPPPSDQPGSVDKQVYVPLRANVTVQLDSATSLASAPGAQVTQDARGTRLKWTTRLPADTDSSGDLALDFSYRTSRLRLPALDLSVAVLPLPASVFSPPGGEDWPTHLRGADPPTLERLAVKAQAGAASLHRIGDLPPPVGRPGPGPERVGYDLTLDSGAVPRPPTAPPAPLRAQPWTVALALIGALVAGANAWWAWSRH